MNLKKIYKNNLNLFFIFLFFFFHFTFPHNFLSLLFSLKFCSNQIYSIIIILFKSKKCKGNKKTFFPLSFNDSIKFSVRFWSWNEIERLQFLFNIIQLNMIKIHNKSVGPNVLSCLRVESRDHWIVSICLLFELPKRIIFRLCLAT